MKRIKIIQKREDLYIVKAIIGGRRHEYKVASKQEALRLTGNLLEGLTFI